MIIHADDYMADKIEVLNLDNGKFLRLCICADDESGKYECYVKSNDPEEIIQYISGKHPTVHRKNNIVFVYKGE